MISPRDIEKLKAIGFDVWEWPAASSPFDFTGWHMSPPYDCHCCEHTLPTEVEAWKSAMEHDARNMKQTVSDKLKLLGYLQLFSSETQLEPTWEGWSAEGPSGVEAIGESPEAAITALFWKVS